MNLENKERKQAKRRSGEEQSLEGVTGTVGGDN